MAASRALRCATPSPVSAEIMNVSRKAKRMLISAVSFKSDDRSTVSILLRTRIAGAFSFGNPGRIASTSSSTPLDASTSRPTRSASPAPPQAEVTIAWSRRRRGMKIPGVSTKMICAVPSIAMPRTRVRVVCTLRETIDTLLPTSAFSSVDLPALGAPINATKPQRVSVLCSLALMSPRATERPRG